MEEFPNSPSVMDIDKQLAQIRLRIQEEERKLSLISRGTWSDLAKLDSEQQPQPTQTNQSLSKSNRDKRRQKVQAGIQDDLIFQRSRDRNDEMKKLASQTYEQRYPLPPDRRQALIEEINTQLQHLMHDRLKRLMAEAELEKVEVESKVLADQTYVKAMHQWTFIQQKVEEEIKIKSMAMSKAEKKYVERRERLGEPSFTLGPRLDEARANLGLLQEAVQDWPPKRERKLNEFQVCFDEPSLKEAKRQHDRWMRYASGRWWDLETVEETVDYFEQFVPVVETPLDSNPFLSSFYATGDHGQMQGTGDKMNKEA